MISRHPRSVGRTAAAFAATLVAGPPALASAAIVRVSGGVSAPVGVLASEAGGTQMPAGGALGTASLAPISLRPPAGALVGQVSVVHGALGVGDTDRTVLLEVFDAQHGWAVAAAGRTDATGAFAIALRPKHIGRFFLRATTTRAPTAPTTSATPTAAIEIYRPARATIFGRGSYGTRTACGQMLTPQLLGVAHLTLPCGTLVDITYGSRTVTVPVVDRGPYVAGRDFDLTTATALAIGFTESVGVASIGVSTGD